MQTLSAHPWGRCKAGVIPVVYCAKEHRAPTCSGNFGQVDMLATYPPGGLARCSCRFLSCSFLERLNFMKHIHEGHRRQASSNFTCCGVSYGNLTAGQCATPWLFWWCRSVHADFCRQASQNGMTVGEFFFTPCWRIEFTFMLAAMVSSCGCATSEFSKSAKCKVGIYAIWCSLLTSTTTLSSIFAK